MFEALLYSWPILGSSQQNVRVVGVVLSLYQIVVSDSNEPSTSAFIHLPVRGFKLSAAVIPRPHRNTCTTKMALLRIGAAEWSES